MTVMPLDHFRVFRNVTRYSSVNREKLYRSLGYIGKKLVNGKEVEGYLVRRVPLQVCSSQTFRDKVTPLIVTNDLPHGIPQGSPISDILANLYLLDFDTAMQSSVESVGGKYYRYSDDILMIIPGEDDPEPNRSECVAKLLKVSGGELNIQPKKTTVHKFWKFHADEHLEFKLIAGKGGKNGLEYLGFRFDGRKVFIRDSTRSRLQRKMTLVAYAMAKRHCINNPGMSLSGLDASFNYDLALAKFYKVRDFETVQTTYNKWTFWTYAMRAQHTFGDERSAVRRQLRNFRKTMRFKL